MAAASSSSARPIRNYDVFLSFRGEDTRRGFTDHLYHALKQAGIHTFRDDDELPRGRPISSELPKAIQESKVSIVVFSQGYASSKWCLDELVQILEVGERQLVLPVFYHVEPSDVRNQRGSFADAFRSHDRDEGEAKVMRWRNALNKAAGLSGFHLQNEHESDFIKTIVEKVLKEVNPIQLHVANYPVGLDSPVEILKSMLDVGGGGVRMVGICGMGGIGKTTIAKYLYNSISSQFDCSSFLENIGAQSNQINGLVLLQEQLLRDTLKNKIEVGIVARGISILKERLDSKRVLIILDDLDNINQLHSLLGQDRWFAPGSRIVVTTRDQYLLDQLSVDERHHITGLNPVDSLKLFSLHAFKETKPLQNLMEVSRQIVSYTQGLPLALEVLGSHLVNRDPGFWKSELEKLKAIPHNEIQSKLRVSFDSLDYTEKSIFLDIACCFESINEEHAFKIFEGCGFYPASGIRRLIDKCLLKISRGDLLTMHDLLRDMGRRIVREKYPMKPEKHTRLWLQHDVCRVLRNKSGKKASAVEGLILDLTMQEDFTTNAFSSMAYLRLIQINNVNLKGSFEGLFQEVRWLCWHRCPLTSLPPGFHPEELISLDMQNSNIGVLWQGTKFLYKLKFLNLNGSEFLTTIPDLTGLPNLEKLLLSKCQSLSSVHPSIGCLGKLVELEFEDCVNLKVLPREICDLKSLKLLNLDGCSILERLPEGLGCMESLWELYLGGTAITKLPDSIGDLGQLVFLYLNHCQKLKTLPSSIGNLRSLEGLCLLNCMNLERLPDSIGLLDNLQELNLLNCRSLKSLPSSIYYLRIIDPVQLESCSNLRQFYKRLSYEIMRDSELSQIHVLDLNDCNMSDEDISYFCCLPIIKELSSLRALTLSGNNFCILPFGLGQLSCLEELDLSDCRSLQTVLELPPKLKILRANNCTALQNLPILSNLDHLRSLELKNCSRLVEIQGIEDIPSISQINLEGCNDLSSTFATRLCQGISGNPGLKLICLPRMEIPKWFEHQGKWGSSVSIDVPPHVHLDFLQLTFWFETGFGIKDGSPFWCHIHVNNDFCDAFVGYTSKVASWVSQAWISHFRVKRGDKLEVRIELHEAQDAEVGKFGVHVEYVEQGGYDIRRNVIHGPSEGSWTKTFFILPPGVPVQTRTPFERWLAELELAFRRGLALGLGPPWDEIKKII